MLYQLDDLDISAAAFRLLFSIIRRAYHSKIVTTFISRLCKKTKLTSYKVSSALDELKENKLLQIIKIGRHELEITLMPKIIKMIDLDYKRRGAGKEKTLSEIKKHKDLDKKNTAKKKQDNSSSTSSKPAQTNHQNFSAKKPVKPAPQQIDLSNCPTNTPKPVPRAKESLKVLNENKTQSRKIAYIGERPEFLTNKNELYCYFREWLKNNNAMTLEIIDSLTYDDLQKRWKQFKQYSTTWLKLQKVTSTPCKDLNKIKFMRQLADSLDVPAALSS